MGIIQWARNGGAGDIVMNDGDTNAFLNRNPNDIAGGPGVSNSEVDPEDVLRENAKLRRLDISTRPTNNLGLTDDQILTGKPDSSGWFQSRIDPYSKTIAVDIGVKYGTDGLSDRDATKLKSLAQNGVSQFWSRPVNLNGESYAVNVNLVDDDNGMPISLRMGGDGTYERSHNMNGAGIIGSVLGALAPLVSRHTSDIYYQKAGIFKNGPELADKDFQVTAAHEIGHPILAAAGGRGFSWSHEGTSGELGGDNGSYLDVPDSGELDLMKYYKNLKTEPQYARSIASANDVKNLIYVSKRN